MRHSGGAPTNCETRIAFCEALHGSSKANKLGYKFVYLSCFCPYVLRVFQTVDTMLMSTTVRCKTNSRGAAISGRRASVRVQAVNVEELRSAKEECAALVKKANCAPIAVRLGTVSELPCARTHVTQHRTVPLSTLQSCIVVDLSLVYLSLVHHEIGCAAVNTPFEHVKERT